MTDAAKSPEEIEDVLASIRRLVSEQPEAEAEAVSLGAGDDAPETPAERLVLTPSFRVQEAGDPWVAVAETAAVDEDTTAWQPNDRLADFDEVSGEAEAEEDAEVPEGTEVSVAPLILKGEPPSDPESAPEDEVAELPEPEDDVASEADIADLEALDGMSSTSIDGDAITGFESETGDDNWPGEGAEAALLTLAARREQQPNAASEEPATPVFSRRRTEKSDPIEDAPTEVASEDEPLSKDVPEPVAQAATTEPTEIAEPATIDEDVQSAEGEAPSAPEPDPAPEPEIAETASEPVAEDLGEDPNPFTFPDEDEGLLDEETLREIIVEVVREELQGVLGQRITRNVRKMVRREIRIALAAEELD